MTFEVLGPVPPARGAIVEFREDGGAAGAGAVGGSGPRSGGSVMPDRMSRRDGVLVTFEAAAGRSILLPLRPLLALGHPLFHQ